MIRNKVFIIGKLSQRELELFERDLFDHSVHMALKIKNLSLTREQIEEVVKNAVDRVLLTYKFGDGSRLGELIKMQVIADLRAEFSKYYPDKLHKVKWPDLAERRPYDKLLEVLQKVKSLPKETVTAILEEVYKFLTVRQQKWLFTIYQDTSITYVQLSKKFGARGIHPSEEVRAIYTQLVKTLKFLEITI